MAENTSIRKSTPNKLANVDMYMLAEQYANGATIPELAEQCGVVPSAISMAMRRTIHANEWAELKELHYETLHDKGLREIRDAEKDLNLARAREAYLRRLEWRMSVECSRFSAKQQITHVNRSIRDIEDAELVRVIEQVSHSDNIAPQHAHDSGIADGEHDK